MTHGNSRHSKVSRRTVLRNGAVVTGLLGLGVTSMTGRVAARNKAELIESIASEADISREDTERVLDAFIDMTTKALKKGNRVALVGFGAFSISKRSARKGRNPQTGKEPDGSKNTTVEYDPTDRVVAAVDLIPGKGDQRRVEKRKKKKKHKKRATLIGPDDIAEAAELERADAKKALDAFIDTTTKALKKGNRVALVGFGSFSVSKRSARKGRNPQTGKEIKIPAKKVVKFKPGAELSEKIK